LTPLSLSLSLSLSDFLFNLSLSLFQLLSMVHWPKINLHLRTLNTQFFLIHSKILLFLKVVWKVKLYSLLFVLYILLLLFQMNLIWFLYFDSVFCFDF
jgi:hypothetical protein